jgi:hypothetical protein
MKVINKNNKCYKIFNYNKISELYDIVYEIIYIHVDINIIYLYCILMYEWEYSNSKNKI